MKRIFENLQIISTYKFLFFQAVIPEDNPSFAFGVKHSPYLYNGRELGRERYVSAKTEMTNGNSGGEFRQRSGTFTKTTVVSNGA